MQKQKKQTAFAASLLLCITFLGMSSSTENTKTDKTAENTNCGSTGPGNWELGYGAYDANEIWQLGMLTQTRDNLSGFYGTQEENINCAAVYTTELKQTLYDDNIKDAQAAYIAQRFATEKLADLNNTKATALQVALWKNAQTSETQITEILNTQTTENVAEINKLAEEYFQEAKKYAGPYSISKNITHIPGSNVGQLNFQIRQKTGQENLVPNIPITLKIDQENTTANIKFSENNSNEITILSEEQTVSVDFTIFTGGNVYFNIETLQLPGHIPYVQRMSTPSKALNNQQAIIITSIDNYEPINDAINKQNIILDFDVNIATESSAVITQPGEAIYDILYVSLPELTVWPTLPGTTNPVEIEIFSTLYGPLNEKPQLTNNVPENTPVVGTVTTIVNQAGSHQTESLVVNDPGFYVWAETVTAIPGGVNAWESMFGVLEETTQINWEPLISSDISNPIAIIGEQVTDKIYQIGFPENFATEELLVTANMYFVPERPVETTEIPANATLFSTQTVPAGNGESTTAKFTPFDQPGCYTIVASFAGNATVNAHTTNFGIPSETACTTNIPPAVDLAQPVVVTTNSKNTLNPQDIIADTIMVSGLPAGTQVEVVSTLYGPFSEKPINQAAPPENMPIVQTVTTTVNNNGLHTTDPVQIPIAPAGSWFTWSETIAATETTLAWQGRFGVTEETSVLNGSNNEIVVEETPISAPDKSYAANLTSYADPNNNSTVSNGLATNNKLAKTGVTDKLNLMFLAILVTLCLGTVCLTVTKKR